MMESEKTRAGGADGGGAHTIGAHPIDRALEVNGLKLHYLDWGGDGAGHTLLLLHGGAAHAHWWDDVAPQLTASARVLALDFRGHGQSQWAIPPRYGPRAYVEDLSVFIQKLGPPVILAGHSMGGAVAQWTTVMFPQLIEALVIIDAPHGAPPLWRRLMWRWRRRARSRTRPELDSARDIIRRFRLAPPETYLTADRLERLAMAGAEQLKNGKWAYRFDPETRAWRRGDTRLARPDIRKITAPTLIVRGAQSTLVTAGVARAMHRRIGGSILREIPRAYHHVPLDNPGDTAAAIAEFIASMPARRAANRAESTPSNPS
ncbi:MAG: alpha/beta fold hydrolase [Candidatus Binataceae bacterium]